MPYQLQAYLANWMFCIFTIRDSKPSGLPDQTEILMHMEVDEMADMMIDMEVYKVAEEVATRWPTWF